MTETDCQIYLISPPDVSGDFPEQLKSALEGGLVAAFQFRVKDIDPQLAAELAAPLLKICREQEVAFVVNDDVTLAKSIGADGLHLGQSDTNLADARAVLGDDVQIGITCHDSRHLAMEAGEGGANYVAFGAFHPTTTKETPYRPEPEILEWWSTMMELPCVAIGGITAGNCTPMVRAGADFLAVSSAIWTHKDGPGEAVRQLAKAIDGCD